MANVSLASALNRFEREPGNLIPVLQRVQHLRGYLSQDAVHSIARHLRISENAIYGVASFYAQFRFHPPGDNHIRVCTGTACHVKGGEQILDTVKRKLNIDTGETTGDGRYDLDRVACLGCCALAPVVMLNDKTFSQMSVIKLQEILDEQEDD
ncbi:MAG: NADH-quinone oxidoreductase subunit NuoE [bacterium]|nr:NADH-quinone oxidoreductase subunit NuoE [bacterium]